MSTHPFKQLRDVPGMQDSTGLMVNGLVEVTQDVTINEPLWLFGTIKPLAGVTVTINGPMIAGAGQCFDLSAGGTIAGCPEVENVLANWWGADPDYGQNSSPAINAAIAFCTGPTKPRLTMLAGRYKCLDQIKKKQSFHCPIIAGVGGGSNRIGDYAGVCWDFSASSLGDEVPCVVIKGGSGAHTHGGVRDIEIVGNGKTTGIQFADQCGSFGHNLMLHNHTIGAEFYNESGFSEWNKLIACQVHETSKYAYRFRRGDKGTNSFHGAELIDCWANLFPTNPGAVHVGPGCLWYNGTAQMRVFFSTGLTQPQDIFVVDPQSYDLEIEGYVKCEGGGGWGRLASGRAVALAGPVLALTGISWGTLMPIKYSMKIGPEGGGANGITTRWFEDQSFGPRAITVDANGDWDAGLHVPGVYDCEIVVTAPYYEYRMSGIARQNGYGNDGVFRKLDVWAINNQRGFGEPVIKVTKQHRLVVSNPKYGAVPGEVKFYIWYRQRSLSVQSNLRFATMNP